MPFTIHWERPFGVREHLTGIITPDDVARICETITSDPGFDDLRYAIIDLLDATGHAFNLQNRSELEVPYVTLIGASYSNPHIHSAYVVTLPPLLELIELKLSLGLLPSPARMFQSEIEAREWLGAISGRFRRPVLL